MGAKYLPLPLHTVRQVKPLAPVRRLQWKLRTLVTARLQHGVAKTAFRIGELAPSCPLKP